jgi:Pyruvate/2-oxoacid:ferredoxin oxidoreductase gamma subunit
MERALIMSGIGGQGVQLAAAAVARAAVAEGREVQVFGSYEGMMRGGATESTLVIGDGPIEAPPTVGEAWAAVVMHHEHSAHAVSRLRTGSVVLVNSTVVTGLDVPSGCRVIAVPASQLAIAAGHLMAGSLVMAGALAAATGLVGLEPLVESSTAALPAYRSQHAARNETALRAGFAAVDTGTAPAWPDAVVPA